MKKITLSLLFTIICFIANAQFTKLADLYTTGNGGKPYDDGLISDGTYLYGTTMGGGLNSKGIVYKIKPDGTGYVCLHAFNTSDGINPVGSLLYDGTWLYGVTNSGGSVNKGVLYKIKTDGTGFVVLKDFTDAFGANPGAGLVSDGTWLYGTTQYGGINLSGTIYRVKTDGTASSTLRSLNNTTDGNQPVGQLYLEGAFLYGTTIQGGSASGGTLFKLGTDGSGFTVLVNFNINTGVNPMSGLISDGTYLYGITTGAKIFKVKPDGSDFAIVYPFGTGLPKGKVCYDGTYLYYVSSNGGTNSNGAIFKVKPEGTDFALLYDFGISPDGKTPNSLLLQGNVIYATTLDGGNGNMGTIYKINPDGTGYSQLFNFNGTNSYYPTSYGALTTDGTWFYGTCAQGPTTTGGTGGLVFKIKPDGEFAPVKRFVTATEHEPQSSLYFDGTYLYGTTYNSGSNSSGTIYKVMPDGSNYTILRAFTSADQNGQYLYCTPVSDGTFLYGVTYQGGVNNKGVIFKIKPDGTGFAKLFDFDGTATGQWPRGSLFYDGTFLYGTTTYGGINNEGTVFKIKPDGTGFVKLLDCSSATIGAYPSSTLISDGTYLYGTMATGYPGGDGSVFRMLPDGTGFSVLHPFTTQLGGRRINGDVLLTGNYLYGMTEIGGINDEGTIFRLRTDGSGFEKLHDFDEPDGRYPMSSLATDGTYLYGTTRVGGVNGYGTIFKLCPQVTNTQTLTICPGESITVGSHTYSANGIFHDTLSAVTSCDSIIITNLTVRAANTYSQSPVLCAGESITVGNNTYSSTGNHVDVLTSVVTGCDSTVTTNLTVLPANTFTQTLTICQGESVTVGNNTYSTANIYTDVLTSLVDGCDSTVTTNLTVDVCTGIGSNALYSAIKIYPNPGIGLVTIESKIEKGNYHVQDVAGKIISKGKLGGNKFIVDLTPFSSGVYFISVSDGERQVNAKVIKQ